jgi:hypothetical protein
MLMCLSFGNINNCFFSSAHCGSASTRFAGRMFAVPVVIAWGPACCWSSSLSWAMLGSTESSNKPAATSSCFIERQLSLSRLAHVVRRYCGDPCARYRSREVWHVGEFYRVDHFAAWSARKFAVNTGWLRYRAFRSISDRAGRRDRVPKQIEGSGSSDRNFSWIAIDRDFTSIPPHRDFPRISRVGLRCRAYKLTGSSLTSEMFDAAVMRARARSVGMLAEAVSPITT